MALLFGSVGMGWEQWLVHVIFFWVRFYVGLVVGAADGLDVGDPKNGVFEWCISGTGRRIVPKMTMVIKHT
jgi:hypothetical protein